MNLQKELRFRTWLGWALFLGSMLVLIGEILGILGGSPVSFETIVTCVIGAAAGFYNIFWARQVSHQVQSSDQTQ